MEGRGRGLKVPSYLRFDGQVGFSPLKNWGKEGKSQSVGEKPEHRPYHGGPNYWTGPHCQGGKGKNLTTRKSNNFLICNRDVEAERWETSSASLLPSSIPTSRCKWSSPIISVQGSTGGSKDISNLSIGNWTSSKLPKRNGVT